MAEISARLDEVRLLTLTGVGGVGKTRLALETARAVHERYPDGVWLVDLAAVHEPTAVTTATATALGIPDHGGHNTLHRLAAHLTHHHALILLDNCEHLTDPCAELAHTLLHTAPHLRILTTTRHTLGIRGEHLYPVPPLPDDDAAELLRICAAETHGGHRLREAAPAAVARVCAHLDGLPLAIQLAAPRLRALTVEQLADRLADRLGTLDGGTRGVAPRRRTMTAAIEYSYELCDPAERLLWDRLSIFAGSFCLDAAEDVCSGEGIAPTEVLDLLDRLTAQSVILSCEMEGQPRYRMLETIRQYGRARLTGSGQEQRLLRRHRDYFLHLACRVADRWWGPGQVADLARLRADQRNLLIALSFEEDPQATLRLAAALRHHWCADGFLGEGRRCLERALAVAPERSPARAEALWVAGWVALLQGDVPAADTWLAEGAELARELRLPAVTAEVLGFQGLSATFKENWEEARDLHASALSAAALGDERTNILTGFRLAFVLVSLGDQQALGFGRRALALAETCGERWGRAHVLWMLGHAALVRGDHRAAVAYARAACWFQQGFNDTVGTALKLALLAWAGAAGGEYQRSARLLGAAWALRSSTSSSAFGPRSAEQHARCVERLRVALGTEGYAMAFAEGARLDSPARALAYALGAERYDATVPEPARRLLTRREQEVAVMVAQGLSDRKIAAALMLSPRTVESHVRKLLTKIEAGNRAQIAAWWAANQAPLR
ncbi:LuxR C-terminal-related transcriptional regulator [Streptomyces sp. SID13726]|uniref:ATP-binding protein n=1 Tax=Streptomyces sp. SID13726 TaxID=2706058 RepID=UPI001EF2ADE3|nr:LuxR C-terminal-related transcriptional regulator [Streptomyces sp. SID13726]